jgi:hypothetical protein
MSTVPFGSNVAVCSILRVVVLPAGLNLPTLGSNNSALPQKSSPSATSTIPVGNKVPVAAHLALVILPVVVNSPVSGSYTSALAQESLPGTDEQPTPPG